MNPTRHLAKLALFIAWLALPISATVARAQTVETGLVELTDSKIEYFSRGEGEPIVLLPGGTLTVGYLDGLADALAKAGHRVVGINFRGSGKSTGPSEGVTLQTMADDVAGVIKALNLGPVECGRQRLRQSRCAHVGRVSPRVDAQRYLVGRRWEGPTRTACGQSLGDYLQPRIHRRRHLGGLPVSGFQSCRFRPHLELFKPSLDPGAAAIEKAAAESTPLDAWWAPPGETKYLILQGAEDQIAPPENGEQLQKELGDRATLVNVPGAAHLLPLEQPEEPRLE